MLIVVLLFILMTAEKLSNSSDKITGSPVVCPKCNNREFILFSQKTSDKDMMEYGFAGTFSACYHNPFCSSASCSAHLQNIK